ncbi:hypothetical protein [Hymenobacter algoricola]|uniref:HTH LytTR-type domain-containing protein n=1 Tax=Hymenobacter algoricola TaxID=486267 RepID=A0ABP7MM13_9BACT
MEEELSESSFLRMHRPFIGALNKIRTYSSRHVEAAAQELPIGRLFRPRVEPALG